MLEGSSLIFSIINILNQEIALYNKNKIKWNYFSNEFHAPFVFSSTLVRVRHTETISQTSNESNTSDESGLYLFGDYAYTDKESKSFHVGRLQRMQRQFDKRILDYKDTVSFRESYLKNISATFCQYSEVNDKCYILNDYRLVSVVASDVLSRVNLSFQKENSNYILTDNEYEMISSEHIPETKQCQKKA